MLKCSSSAESVFVEAAFSVAISIEAKRFSALKGFSGWVGDHRPRSDKLHEPFLDALCDDLNTPQAITELFALLKEIKSASVSDAAQDERVDKLANSLTLLGLGDLADFKAGAVFRTEEQVAGEKAHIEALIAARNAARKTKDFRESDRIRDELAAKGIVLKDGPAGTTWEVKR